MKVFSIKRFTFIIICLLLVPNLSTEKVDCCTELQYKSVDIDFILDENGFVDTTITIQSFIRSNITQEYIISPSLRLDLKTIDDKSIEISDLHNPKTNFVLTTALTT